MVVPALAWSLSPTRTIEITLDSFCTLAAIGSKQSYEIFSEKCGLQTRIDETVANERSA